jgi:DNA processing protein
VNGGVSATERRDRLRLARTDNVGPVTYGALMARYGAAAKALDALPHLAARGGRTSALKPTSIAEAEREIEAGERLGAVLITVGEPAFPRPLAALDPPPPVLWLRGHPTLTLKPAVAIVGARIASAAGQRFARALASDLGQAGYVVVSGLARGVDGAAHEGGLRGGTVAVLAGGVDDIYPPEHKGLYGRIVAEGCVVSENAVGRRATAKDFPRRNRIISGLSLGVVVVEAEQRSGSLITARLAAEQGRDVFAVPGSPLDPRAKGPNDLIRQGAILCEGIDDILRALPSPKGFVGEPQLDLFGEPERDQTALDAAADRLRERVFASLSPTPVPRDEIVRALDAPAPGVLAALVELALAGRCELLAGGLVARGD